MITILPGDMTLLDAADLARSRGELLLIDGRRSVLSPTPIIDRRQRLRLPNPLFPVEKM